MSTMRYPAEETSPDSNCPDQEKERGNKIKEEGDKDGEDDIFPGYASRAEIIDALEEAYKNDPKLQTKLLYYALKQIRLYFKKDTIESNSAEDVVQIIMEKLIKGKRKWDKKRTPNIIHLVLMAVISYIRNERKRIKNQKRKGAIEYIDHYDKEGFLNENNLPELIRAYTNEDLKDDEFRNDVEKFKQKCFMELEAKNDIEGYYVFEQIIERTYSTDEADTNIQIAEDLNITVSEVENAKKRIKNLAKKIRL